MKQTFPKATPEQFTATAYATAQDKAREVNAVVSFLASGMSPGKFTARVYRFFTQTLSMSACFNRDGFIHTFLTDTPGRISLLAQASERVDDYAMLDAERGADVARLFCADETFDRESDTWHPPGPYATLLDPETHGIHPCGHERPTKDCGGCDPGAVACVILADGSRRPFDPALDLAESFVPVPFICSEVTP